MISVVLVYVCLVVLGGGLKKGTFCSALSVCRNHTWLASRNFKLYIIGVALRNVGQLQSFGVGLVQKGDRQSIQRNTNADAAHGGFIFRAVM